MQHISRLGETEQRRGNRLRGGGVFFTAAPLNDKVWKLKTAICCTTSATNRLWRTMKLTWPRWTKVANRNRIQPANQPVLIRFCGERQIQDEGAGGPSSTRICKCFPKLELIYGSFWENKATLIGSQWDPTANHTDVNNLWCNYRPDSGLCGSMWDCESLRV